MIKRDSIDEETSEHALVCPIHTKNLTKRGSKGEESYNLLIHEN